MDIKQFLSTARNRDLTYNDCYQTNDDDEGPVYCHVCYEVVSGPAYIYKDDGYVTWGVHKTCGDSPCKIEHPLHPDHPLEADCFSLEFRGSSPITRGFICPGCTHFSFGFGYRCRTCNFKLDFRCAFNLQIQQQLPQEAKKEIKVDFHDHTLQQFFHSMLLPIYIQDLEDITCSCCSRGFDGSGFACIKCSLFIRESCLHNVPRGKRITSPFHLQHPLVLQRSRIRIHQRYCQTCQAIIPHGNLYLSCLECRPCDFHISCGSVTTSGLRLKQYHEEHPLYYLYSDRDLRICPRTCVVCNSISEKSHIYGCLSCDVYVHFECIPLPSVVKSVYHTYEDHALTLCNSRNPLDRLELSIDEYYCTICETKGNFNHPFYHCEPCSEIAHVDCVLSQDDPPLEMVECLVPRPVQKLELDSIEESSPEKSEEEEESDNHNEQKASLKRCSTMEIDERIIAIRKN